jgi:hypothetical protein
MRHHPTWRPASRSGCRSLASNCQELQFGTDVRLSDLCPEKYLAANGYVTREPLNACDPEHLRSSLEQADLACRAIITNTPHNTSEAYAIVSNLIALVEGRHVDLGAALFRSIWGSEPRRLAYLNRPSFYGEILCCWRPWWIPGTKKMRCTRTHGTYAERHQRAAHR